MPPTGGRVSRGRSRQGTGRCVSPAVVDGRTQELGQARLKGPRVGARQAPSRGCPRVGWSFSRVPPGATAVWPTAESGGSRGVDAAMSRRGPRFRGRTAVMASEREGEVDTPRRGPGPQLLSRARATWGAPRRGGVGAESGFERAGARLRGSRRGGHSLPREPRRVLPCGATRRCGGAAVWRVRASRWPLGTLIEVAAAATWRGSWSRGECWTASGAVRARLAGSPR